MNNIIIGFAGRKGSGKSAAAVMLERTGFVRLSFAEPIRAMLKVLLHHLHYDDLVIDKLLREDKDTYINMIKSSPRKLMQSLGTDWGRCMVDDELWLKIARQKMLNLSQSGRDIVFDDVRFENEASLIRSMGGVIYHIQRNCANLEYDGHPSEIGIYLNRDDILIRNEGTLQNLLDEIMTHVRVHKYKLENLKDRSEAEFKTNIDLIMGWNKSGKGERS